MSDPQTYKIRSVIHVYYESEVEAHSPQEAVEIIESGEWDAGVQTETSGHIAEEYTIPGQMGWNDVEELEESEG